MIVLHTTMRPKLNIICSYQSITLFLYYFQILDFYTFINLSNYVDIIFLEIWMLLKRTIFFKKHVWCLKKSLIYIFVYFFRWINQQQQIFHIQQGTNGKSNEPVSSLSENLDTVSLEKSGKAYGTILLLWQSRLLNQVCSTAAVEILLIRNPKERPT